MEKRKQYKKESNKRKKGEKYIKVKQTEGRRRKENI